MGYFDTQFALQSSDVVGFTESQRTAIEMQVCTSIGFESTWLYKNLKYPRYKNFYGYCQIMTGAFVVDAVPLSYLNQEILHWRDYSFGINQTTGCYARGVAEMLTPSKVLIPNTVKTRQRFTSIRFRLLPGIIANVSIVYETGEPKCEDNVLEPDGKQGQPPLPDNSGASPNPRPANQPGDETDPSNNDGNDAANDGKPDAPTAGGGGGSASWKVQVSLYDYDDRPNNFTHNLRVTDRSAKVSVATRPNGGAANSGGKSDSTLTMTVNGVTSDRPITGFGMNVFTPYYG